MLTYGVFMRLQHVGGAPCGCCWAFATIGVTECIVGMALGQPISLSEQQLIDCDKGGGAPAAVPSACCLAAQCWPLARHTTYSSPPVTLCSVEHSHSCARLQSELQAVPRVRHVSWSDNIEGFRVLDLLHY